MSFSSGLGLDLDSDLDSDSDSNSVYSAVFNVHSDRQLFPTTIQRTQSCPDFRNLRKQSDEVGQVSDVFDFLPRQDSSLTLLKFKRENEDSAQSKPSFYFSQKAVPAIVALMAGCGVGAGVYFGVSALFAYAVSIGMLLTVPHVVPIVLGVFLGALAALVVYGMVSRAYGSDHSMVPKQADFLNPLGFDR